jgi:hypothetical protein
MSWHVPEGWDLSVQRGGGHGRVGHLDFRGLGRGRPGWISEELVLSRVPHPSGDTASFFGTRDARELRGRRIPIVPRPDWRPFRCQLPLPAPGLQRRPIPAPQSRRLPWAKTQRAQTHLCHLPRNTCEAGARPPRTFIPRGRPGLRLELRPGPPFPVAALSPRRVSRCRGESGAGLGLSQALARQLLTPELCRSAPP